MVTLTKYQDFNARRKSRQKVSVAMLEKQMTKQYEMKAVENLEAAIKMADQILIHDKSCAKAYTTAAESYSILGDQHSGLKYLDRLLAINPDNIDGLSLKMLLCDAIYQETNEHAYLLEAIETSSHALDLTKNDIGMLFYIISNCPTISHTNYDSIEGALTVEPDNAKLLYMKGVTLTDRFERGLGDDSSFSDLVQTVNHMQRVHPKDPMTETLISEGYNSLGTERQRIYRKAIDREDIHESNIRTLK